MTTISPTPTHAAPDPVPPRLALRPAEAAAALGIGRRKLWELTAGGQIPCVHLGRAVLYPTALLEKWLVDQAERGRQR